MSDGTKNGRHQPAAVNAMLNTVLGNGRGLGGPAGSVFGAKASSRTGVPREQSRRPWVNNVLEFLRGRS